MLGLRRLWGIEWPAGGRAGAGRVNRKARRRAAKIARADLEAGPPRADISDTLAKAGQLRDRGRTVEAEVLYLHVLRAIPEQPDALHWLGVFQHMRGQSNSALELLRLATALHSDPLYLFHLGEVQRALGDFALAVKTYLQAIRLAPGVADLRFGLGSALLELGRAAEAVEQLRLAIRLAPSDAQAHNNLANALTQLGQGEAAIEHYRWALQLQPSLCEANLNLGLALADRGQYEEAIPYFHKGLQADTGLVAAWLGLVRSLLHSERVEDALEVARKAVELHPRSAEVQGILGQSLFRQNLIEQALMAFRTAVELNPNYADAYFNAGACLQSLGLFAEAAEAHERALALRPDLTEAHYNLAMIGERVSAESRIAQLQALLFRPALSERKRTHAYFALGKLMEGRADFDSAFEYYRRGNDLKARSLPFDPQRHVDFVDRLISTFDESFFAARRECGEPSETPVFILGMPRSGTSLVEQILACHPKVHGAGELNHMRQMVKALPSRLGCEQPFPDCTHLLDDQLAGQLAREYLDRLRQCAPPGIRRVTDKLTGNYLRLGLIAVLLPSARVIHCRRNPLDTCLSCYLQSFAHGLSFTYDLSHLGLVYRQYVRLMDHWRQVLPLRIIDQDYEALVVDQVSQSKRLVTFCGLSWDERCLAFHRQARQVNTASFWQVRQPLYSSSVERWRSYSNHLRPLLDSLGDLIES